MKSLRNRLYIGLGLILIIGFGVQWGLRNHLIPMIAEEQMLTRLNHDIEALRSAISCDARGALTIDLTKQLPVFRQARWTGGDLLKPPYTKAKNDALPPFERGVSCLWL